MVAKRSPRSHRFDDFVDLGAKAVARDGAEVGAGDADHPGLLRVRGGAEEAKRVGSRPARAEHEQPGKLSK
jgi:hypothetical protein